MNGKCLLLVLVLVLIGSYLFYSYEYVNNDLYSQEKSKLEKTQLELKNKTRQYEIVLFAYNKLPIDGKNNELYNEVVSKYSPVDPNLMGILFNIGKGK